jgi:hypothetical protein
LPDSDSLPGGGGPGKVRVNPAKVWYVAYGSNMNAGRLRYYFSGGRPPGAARTYPGCRDPRPPTKTVPLRIPGGIYFALESITWTGGMAFYDPGLPGLAAARGYLITAGQFTDIVAQEMVREPNADLDLSAVLTDGRVTLGPGRYETLIRIGTKTTYPMLTFTAPWRAADVAWTAPSPRYLSIIAEGLRAAQGWDNARIAAYLAGRPGVAGRMRRRDVAACVEATSPRIPAQNRRSGEALPAAGQC